MEGGHAPSAAARLLASTDMLAGLPWSLAGTTRVDQSQVKPMASAGDLLFSTRKCHLLGTQCEIRKGTPDRWWGAGEWMAIQPRGGIYGEPDPRHPLPPTIPCVASTWGKEARPRQRWGAPGGSQACLAPVALHTQGVESRPAPSAPSDACPVPPT